MSGGGRWEIRTQDLSKINGLLLEDAKKNGYSIRIDTIRNLHLLNSKEVISSSFEKKTWFDRMVKT